MSTRFFHLSRAIWPPLLAACLCSATGCWEEVHYTGSTTAKEEQAAKQPMSSATPGVTEEGSAFGDELVKELATQSKGTEPGPVEPIVINAEPAATPSRGGAGQYTDSRYNVPLTQSTPSTVPSSPSGQLGDIAANRLNNGASEPSPLPFVSEPPRTNTAPASSVMPPATTVSPLTPELPKSIADTEAPPAVPQTVQPELKATSTKQAAWLLGSRWSLAALARERGAAEKDVSEWVRVADAQAAALGVTLQPIPPLESGSVPAAAGSTSPTVSYLIAEGKRVGPQLASKYGADHAALFELALKSNLLLTLYKPGAPVVESLATGILQARERCGMPNEVSRPLLASISERREPAVVRQLVFRLHDEVDKTFTAPAGR